MHRHGQIIGFASQPIRAGQHVHTHNLAMGEFARDYAFSQGVCATVPSTESATFRGIVREDGRVATRRIRALANQRNHVSRCCPAQAERAPH
ncbi:SAF domain-containing protein [Paraburkholderia sp. WC7.3g]|uniref:SAF domain-containing protein n=1 Tax=Paraburkholderia sp. WC7.3g TaxID=2991070 RepID=UPI003D1D848D